MAEAVGASGELRLFAPLVWRLARDLGAGWRISATLHPFLVEILAASVRWLPNKEECTHDCTCGGIARTR